jgi:HTH-type transcriptional regulator, transcriptional repressor of NAD biosynthesis genes
MSKRFRTGLIVGKFAPPHNGHVYLIEQAAKQCERLDVFVYSNPELPAMPHYHRSRLLGDSLKEKHRGSFIVARVNDCDVHVWNVSSEHPPTNRSPAWRHHAWVLERYRYFRYPEQQPDAVFAAEDYVHPFAGHLRSTPVQFSRINGITGRAIRREPYAYPQITWLPRPVQEYYNTNYPEKVAFVGAESTGKSTIARACANDKLLQGAYIEEVGAHVFNMQGGKMDKDGSWNYTVRLQCGLQDAAIENNIKYRYIFSDTEALTTKFFMYWFLGRSNETVDKYAEESKDRYKHWFLCDDGIPFDGTNMRGPQEIRKVHQGMIRMMLDERGIEYDILRGTVAQRLAHVKSVLSQRRHRDWVGALE